MSVYSKYNSLQILYWFACCCVMGFIAVFLKFCGLSNSEIGIVSGGGAVLSIFLSPFISSLVGKLKKISLQQMMMLILGLTLICFMIITFLPVPSLVTMVLYISMYALMLSAVPIMTMIAMNYLEQGIHVDFGTARGMGSTSWAVGALLFGKIIDWFNPSVLTIGYLITCVFIFILLLSMPPLYQSEAEAKSVEDTVKSEENVLSVLKKYKTFAIILVGFTFVFAGSTALGTYLINIIQSIGGNTSLLGIVMFVMAFSEMPIMSLSGRLIQRFNALTLIAIGAFFYTIRNIGLCFAPNLVVFIICAACQGVSYGLMTGVITYYVNQSLERQDRMAGQTLIGIMTSGIGSTLGNVLGGFLIDGLGMSAMYYFVTGCTIFGSCIVFIAKYLSTKS
ncbi:MAG: MFS transporter [Bacillota bacterium]|nr:MFS transporter [Bacillota bacterium]